MAGFLDNLASIDFFCLRVDDGFLNVYVSNGTPQHHKVLRVSLKRLAQEPLFLEVITGTEMNKIMNGNTTRSSGPADQERVHKLETDG